MSTRVQLRPPRLDEAGTTYKAVTFPLWSGTATVLVAEPGRLDVARRAVDKVIADIDASCNAYRSDSDLARVKAGAGRPVYVGATFHAVLWTALYAADVTKGLVDPTFGSATQVDWRSILVDEPCGTVTLPAGATLDFGSVGKAFAADRAAELAAGEADCGVLVDFGGDIAAAGPVPAAGWPVRVGDEQRAGWDGGSPSGQDILLREPGGIATSSVAVRLMPPGGRVVPHIVDPRSGRHVHGPWQMVTVAAGSCVDANTASTAATVRGEDAVEWLACCGLPARLVHTDGWTITVPDWPEERALSDLEASG